METKIDKFYHTLHARKYEKCLDLIKKHNLTDDKFANYRIECLYNMKEFNKCIELIKTQTVIRNASILFDCYFNLKDFSKCEQMLGENIYYIHLVKYYDLMGNYAKIIDIINKREYNFEKNEILAITSLEFFKYYNPNVILTDIMQLLHHHKRCDIISFLLPGMDLSEINEYLEFDDHDEYYNIHHFIKNSLYESLLLLPDEHIIRDRLLKIYHKKFLARDQLQKIIAQYIESEKLNCLNCIKLLLDNYKNTKIIDENYIVTLYNILVKCPPYKDLIWYIMKYDFSKLSEKDKLYILSCYNNNKMFIELETLIDNFS